MGRDDDEEHARRLREDGYELVSNISSLPAYPSSIGDWIAEDGDDVDDEESDPAILEARARRRREAEATFRAQATHAKAEATSRARADPESTSAAAGADELELDGGCESFGGPEDALERARETRRERQWRRAVGGAYPDRPLAAFPSSIGDWVAPSPSGADDAEYDEPFYEKPIFDLCDDEAAPNLRAFVDAMEPTLRASLATIGQVDVAAVLDSHVAALFHIDEFPEVLDLIGFEAVEDLGDVGRVQFIEPGAEDVIPALGNVLAQGLQVFARDVLHGAKFVRSLSFSASNGRRTSGVPHTPPPGHRPQARSWDGEVPRPACR